MMAGAQQAVRESQIPAEMGRLINAVERASERTNGLMERLNCVCRPEQDTNKPPMAGPPVHPSSTAPLADGLATQVSRIDYITERLESILARLEV